MKNPAPPRIGLALIASIISFAIQSLHAQLAAPSPVADLAPALQSDGSPSAAVAFANGASAQIRCRSGRFPLVASSSGQSATINLQLPAGAARNLIVQPLDGGAVNVGAQGSAVAADGTTSFQFQSGGQPGRYRVLLNDGGVTTLLQFWVSDPQNPQANPPTVQAH